MEAKKLTENSYLLSDNYGNKLGLGLKIGSTVFFTYDLNQYSSMEDIASSFNEKLIYSELPSNEEATKELFGYPIKHDKYFNEEQVDNLATYKIRQDSDIVYVAGWWVIGTDSIYRATLSPKLKTINADSIGPFTNKFDCQAEVTRMNKSR